jgi:hypothetical protein
MTATTSSRVRFDIGNVFTRTFVVIGANFVPFFVLALLFEAIPVGVANVVTVYAATNLAASDHWLVQTVTGLVQMALGYVLTGALVRGTIVDLDGRNATLGDCLSYGLRYAAPAFVLALITTFCYLLGLIALVIPAVILMLAWSVAIPVLVCERKGIFGSLARSRELTRGHRWALLGLYVCAGLLLILLSLPFGIVSLVLIATTHSNVYAALIVNAFVASLEAMFLAVLTTAAYAELRGTRDGVSVAQLAAIFD